MRENPSIGTPVPFSFKKDFFSLPVVSAGQEVREIPQQDTDHQIKKTSRGSDHSLLYPKPISSYMLQSGPYNLYTIKFRCTKSICICNTRTYLNYQIKLYPINQTNQLLFDLK